MKHLIKIIILLLVFCPALSYSQELKICDEGINKCGPLRDDPKKYSKCMHLMCYQYYSDKEKAKKDEADYFFEYVELQDAKMSKVPKNKITQEIARTCEYGIRKCEALSANQEYYWNCMTDSCKNPDNNTKPDCDDGRSQCVDKQKIYNDCMKLTCGNSAATFNSCPEAKYSCIEAYKTYWQCMYKVCLGPIDQYMKPSEIEKYLIVKDKNGIKRRIRVDRKEPIIQAAPSWAEKAPPGVDPDEWVRDTPQKFMITGNPADYMKCLIPTAMIDCNQNDIRSCRCSDGSYPIMMNGVPSPKYRDN